MFETYRVVPNNDHNKMLSTRRTRSLLLWLIWYWLTHWFQNKFITPSSIYFVRLMCPSSLLNFNTAIYWLRFRTCEVFQVLCFIRDGLFDWKTCKSPLRGNRLSKYERLLNRWNHFKCQTMQTHISLNLSLVLRINLRKVFILV